MIGHWCRETRINWLFQFASEKLGHFEKLRRNLSEFFKMGYIFQFALQPNSSDLPWSFDPFVSKSILPLIRKDTIYEILPNFFYTLILLLSLAIGHFIVSIITTICDKHSSLTARIGKRVKTRNPSSLYLTCLPDVILTTVKIKFYKMVEWFLN